MSKVNTDAIKPRDTGLDITLGATGDTTVISADSINANTVKDSGGNTLWTSDGAGNLSSVNSSFSGNLILLNTSYITSAVQPVSFTLDSTYDVYIFKLIRTACSVDDHYLQFNVSTDGGSSYNVNKTSSFWNAYHADDNSAAGYSYEQSYDVASDGGWCPISYNVGTAIGKNQSGELHLYTPSSTTYMKHFYSCIQINRDNARSYNCYVGGYCNTTTAINAIGFRYEGPNTFATGIIKQYGLS